MAERYWNAFMKSGKIEDYLRYRKEAEDGRS